MGNHTTPYDEHMDQQSYTVAENWGGQINFMIPLDGSIVETCKMSTLSDQYAKEEAAKKAAAEKASSKKTTTKK